MKIECYSPNKPFDAWNKTETIASIGTLLCVPCHIKGPIHWITVVSSYSSNRIQIAVEMNGMSMYANLKKEYLL